MIFLQQLSRK